MSILEELWYGRINPSQRTQLDDKSASELTERIAEKEDELAALLSDEAKEIPEQMRDKQSGLSTSNERKAFVSGFRLGAGIMLETVDEKDVSSIDDQGEQLSRNSLSTINYRHRVGFPVVSNWRVGFFIN